MPTEAEIQAARAELDRQKQAALNNLKEVEKARAAFEATIDPSLGLLMQERDAAEEAATAAADAAFEAQRQLEAQQSAYNTERGDLLLRITEAETAKTTAEQRTLALEAELRQARSEIDELRNQLAGN